MDVCLKRFDFFNQCLNSTDNNFLNTTRTFQKDFQKNFYKNEFILTAGFILTFILDSSLIKKKLRVASNAIFSEETKLNILTKILSILCLVTSLILSPIIIIIFSTCFIYRTIIHFILKYKIGSNFVELLEGTDVVWAIEDVSKSVINILAIIQIENIEEFKEKLTKKMSKIVENSKFVKLKYCREKKYGYYYWTQTSFNINKQINYLPLQQNNSLNKNELLEILSECSNKPLPNNHTTLWEILIGQQQLANKNQHPILFRFHHTVGDGISLLKILLEASDVEINEEDKQNTPPIKIKLLSFFLTLLSIIFMPAHLIRMNFMKNVDDNVLHGKELSGEKILAWVSEDENFPILENVKYIKSQFLGVSFLDVVLAGLSQAFYEYFKKKNADIPSTLTSVILERVEKIFPNELSKPSTTSSLQNRFSVAMMTLPIFPLSTINSEHDAGNIYAGNDFQMFERLQEVNRETKMLKSGPDYQVNYWLLKVVSKLSPEPILRSMLHSAHSTMVVSNIFGPPGLITICDGHLINDLIFWIPHRGLTGIGVSILSHGGKLQLGISVDKALISNSKETEEILQNFVKNLKIFSDKLKLQSGCNTTQKFHICNITYLLNKC